jgi:hypothetical protein
VPVLIGSRICGLRMARAWRQHRSVHRAIRNAGNVGERRLREASRKVSEGAAIRSLRIKRVFRRLSWLLVRQLSGWSTSLRRRINEYGLLLLLIALSVGIAVLPLNLPEAGAFGDPSRLSLLLGTLAGTLAAIAAIVVAVMFVVFEAMRATYAGFAFREVLSQPILRNLVAVYVFAIALALSLIASIGEEIPASVISLAYFNVALGGVCLFGLYPAMKQMLLGARVGRARIASLASSATTARLERLSYAQRMGVEEALSALDEHPLFTLGEIGARSVGAGDRITPRYVLLELGRVARHVLDEWDQQEGQRLRDIINTLLITVRPIGRAVIEFRDEATAVSLLALAEEIHERAAERGVPWYSLIEFNEWLGELTSRIAASGMEHGSRSAGRAIQSALLAHLKQNVPPEAEIWVLHPFDERDEPVDHEKSNAWTHISSDYLRLLAQVHKAAVRADQPGTASAVLFSLIIVIDEIARLDTLGPLQKTAVIRTASYYRHSMTLAAVRKWAWQSEVALSTGASLQLGQGIREGEAWAKDALIYYCLTIRELAQLDEVDSWTLNALGTLGRGCVRSAVRAQTAEALLLICDTLLEVARIYASRSSRTTKDVVREVEEQLHSFLKWFESEGVKHPDLEKYIADAIERVRELGVLGTGAGKLVWPSLDSISGCPEEKAPRHGGTT